MSAAAERGGFALAFCLLLATAMSLLAAGMLVLAEREVATAAAAARLTEARTRAETGARRAFARWSTRQLADLGIGETRVVLSAPDLSVNARRLGPDLFLLRSDAVVRTGPAPGVASAGLLVRVIDPAALGSAAAAVAAEQEAELRAGHVSGQDACGMGADVAGAAAPSVVTAADVVVRGDPPVAQGPAPPSLLGAVPVAAVAEITVAASAGSPAPVAAEGVCQPGPWNWGGAAPGPCDDRRPLVHAPADLLLHGGSGQGTLVVDGDLTINGDFRFRGVLLVRGRLLIDGPDVRIAGHVRARQLVLTAGILEYDSCAVSRATRAPALDRAFRPADRWWVPLF